MGTTNHQFVSDVRAALVQAVMDGAFVSSTVVALPNMIFEPPEGATWLKVSFVPAHVVPASLGAQGLDEVSGFLQVDVNTPEGEGEAAAMVLVDALRARFYAGSRWYSSDAVVRVSSCVPSQGRQVNNFYRISVTIMFYSQIKRSA
jgi:hypothetical protein